MLLTDVLVATDMNPTYYQFIPSFIKAWKTLFPAANIHIVLIANVIIPELLPYKEHIKLFSPIEGIETSFIAQNVRLFYPPLLTEAKGGILITDMDILPMNTSYYADPIKDIGDDKFVCYRQLGCVGPKEMVMCYNIARHETWKSVFETSSEDDVREKIKAIYGLHKYKGKDAGIDYKPFWITDQLYLYEKTQDWNKRTQNLIILNDKITKFRRLDRGRMPEKEQIIHVVKNKLCTDFHVPRPYMDNKVYINAVIALL